MENKVDTRPEDIALRPIDFDNYPEGFQEVMDVCLDYLPEAEREGALMGFIRAYFLY